MSTFAKQFLEATLLFGMILVLATVLKTVGWPLSTNKGITEDTTSPVMHLMTPAKYMAQNNNSYLP
ncbi:MAG: hypothetical protein WCG27_09790 [Pseudomonadota bacterium]